MRAESSNPCICIRKVLPDQLVAYQGNFEYRDMPRAFAGTKRALLTSTHNQPTMAMRISPITAQLGKLSIGVGSATSRTSIRLAHTAKRRKQGRIEPSFEPGHGEQIFVFNHFVDGFTVYSHSSVLKVCSIGFPCPSHYSIGSQRNRLGSFANSRLLPQNRQTTPLDRSRSTARSCGRRSCGRTTGGRWR